MNSVTRPRAPKSKVEQGTAVGGWNMGGQAECPHTYRQRPLLDKNGVRVEREHKGAAGRGFPCTTMLNSHCEVVLCSWFAGNRTEVNLHRVTLPDHSAGAWPGFVTWSIGRKSRAILFPLRFKPSNRSLQLCFV